METVRGGDHNTVRRWFRFAYPLQSRTDRREAPEETRDTEAAIWLGSVLERRGYRFAGPAFNPTTRQPKQADPYDGAFLTRTDLLALTTRPPLDDEVEGTRSRIARGHTLLEAKVFACIRRHLARVSGARVTVSDVHTRASEQIARLGNVQFRQKGAADIDKVFDRSSGRWLRYPRKPHTTLAYLVFEKRAWEGGPALLAAFGMDSFYTLAWNAFLAQRCSELIATVPFLIGEIVVPELPARPRTLDFVQEWDVRMFVPDDEFVLLGATSG